MDPHHGMLSLCPKTHGSHKRNFPQMKEPLDPKILFTRRAFLLAGGQALLAGGMLSRLYWLQITSKDHFTTLSDQNRLHSELILPLRGQILDAHGRMLAGNHRIHRAVLRVADAPDWKESLYRAGEFLHLEESILHEMMETIPKQSRFAPHVIKEILSWEEVALLELHASSLLGITVEEGQKRFYPHPFECCHVLGYVAKPSKKEREEVELTGPHTNLYTLPDFRLGKTGIEKMFNAPLSGIAGLKQVEVNATRRIVREVESYAPEHGADVRTTLNLALQQKIYDHVKDFESISVVVMDIKTGGCRALLSTPGFDINHFTQSIPQKIWANLRDDRHRPLLCKFAQGQYAPGSTVKMLVALAGLEEKVITPDTRFFCPGHHDIGGHRFHCWKHEVGHGSLNVRQAIPQSCDVFFYELSLKLGVEKIANMAKRFGLGTRTELNFPHEKPGLIPSKSWKEKAFGKKWTPSETILTSIGQGYVLATPLQLCVMTARLASEGKKVEPTLWEEPFSENQNMPNNKKEFLPLSINPEHLALVRKGMRDVMSNPMGTAYGARSTLADIEFAGKTGTAQVRRLSHKDRKEKTFQKWPWHWRDHALFVGYAPVQDPRYALSIIVEHGGSGGKIAAPLGRDILTLCLNTA